MLYNKHNLSVAKIASKDQMRPELAGVLFKKDRTVATDTFRLLEVMVDEGSKPEDYPIISGASAMRGCQPFIVPAKQVKELKIKKSGLPICENVAIKHVDGERVEFINIDGETMSADVKTMRRVDGQFPEYEQIFPQGKPVVELLVDPRLLGELLMVMAEKDQMVRMSFYGEEKPVKIESAGDKIKQRSRALMMPMRQ